MSTETGIFFDHSGDEYRKRPGLNFSGLKELHKSPAHYRAYLKAPREMTKDLLIGSAVHAGFLENGFDTGLVKIAPGSTRATKIYKEFAEANASAILLLEDEAEQVKAMIAALHAHPTVAALFAKPGRAEVSAYWTDLETGIACKCRPDKLTDDALVIDLKTTVDASPQGFQSSIAKFKYHWQSAWYLDGIGALLGKSLQNFVHVAVEKEPPYGIGIYVLDDASIEKARQDIAALRARYAECLHTGEWPSYLAEIQNISIPNYEFFKEVVA